VGRPPGAPVSSPVVWIDGRRCDAESAAVSIFDRGFLYGDGVFAVLRGRGGRACDLEGHLDQLTADAGLLALQPPPRSALTATVEEVLGALGVERARLRIIISRGISRGAGGLAVRWREVGSRVIVIGEEDAAPRRQQVRACVLDEPRLSFSQTWAPKSLSYQPALWARERAAERGAEEGLRLFPDSTVGEGAASNLFAIFYAGGNAGRARLVTPPPSGIRPGVTRRRILELCAAAAADERSDGGARAGDGAGLALRAEERALSQAELRAADELFVTSSIAGVVPITSLDGEPRQRGARTEHLSLAYERWLDGRRDERDGAAEQRRS
jgi:branched-chain amino acid aminotransferase